MNANIKPQIHLVKPSDAEEAAAWRAHRNSPEGLAEIAKREAAAWAADCARRAGRPDPFKPGFDCAGNPMPGQGAKPKATSAEVKALETKPKPKATPGPSYHRVTDIQAEHINWLWPNRLAIGKITLHAGYPGTGKSQFALDVAARLSNGTAWPFAEGTAPLKATLVLSAEDDKADTIKPRLMAAGANTDLVFVVSAIVTTADGVRTMNIQDDLAQLDEIIAELAKEGIEVGFIIIDPISAYVGGKGKGDSFKNTEMRAMLTPLGEWAARRKVAILAISHFNKGGNAHHDYKITDSLAFVAVARVILFSIIEKDDDGTETGRTLLLPGKTNIGAKAESLAYKIVGATVKDAKIGDIKTSRLEWTGVVATTADDAFAEHKGHANPVDKAETFLQLVLLDGPMLVDDIRRRAKEKHSWGTLERAKKKLGIVSERRGGTGPNGHWCWYLPDPDAPSSADNDAAVPF
jgi:putative DNA primase/helicase